MKLGYIDYLNCYPFYFEMFEKKAVKGVELFPGYPNVLNKMMAHGQLDMGPISSATCGEITDDVMVLSQFCLSSVGYVGSVLLVSKVPIEDLNKKKLGITSSSHTSVVLLKIILKKYYDQNPDFIPAGPRPSLKDMDAALIIGNDAMVRPTEPASYVYDLGDLWMRKTGFPMVFAVFAVRKKILNQYKSLIKKIISSYRSSLDSLEKDKKTLVLKAKKRYPDIIYDIDSYYDRLKFEFDDNLKKALMFYFDLAGEMGLIKPVKHLQYL